MNVFVYALKLILLIAKRIDCHVLVRFLSFSNYEKFHRCMGFPLVKLNFYCRLGYWPNINQPESFNERLLSDRLLARRDLTPIVSDKLAVREYVKEKVGDEYLIPLLDVYENLDELKDAALPSECVLKMNHSSGQIIIRKEGSDVSPYYPKVKSWFNDKYRFQELMWFSQTIKRKMVVEKLLKDASGQVPKDYKFFVFKGEVAFIQVDLDRFNGHSRTLYSPDWNPLDIRYSYPRGYVSDRPKQLEKMLYIAKVLGKDFTFMRVDLYEVGGRIFFGELTSYPSAACGKFDPLSFDYELGEKMQEIDPC